MNNGFLKKQLCLLALLLLCGMLSAQARAAHTHDYENGICRVCDAAHPNLAKYQGKVVSVLGVSTSSFAGYIPTADGFNLEHRARYPQDNLLTDVNEMWWMQVIFALNAKLGINDSWAGSTVCNLLDSNSGDFGPDAAMASLTRIQNLGANGSPDVIIVFGGGNDVTKKVPLVDFVPQSAPTEVDLETKKWANFTDSFVAMITRLQHFYPDSTLLVMLSGYSYANETRNSYNDVMQAVCEHYGVSVIDMRGNGITSAMLPDGTHPNAEGMDLITRDVLAALLAEPAPESGENVVYTVTHKLSDAAAEKHYYKGVSAGMPFAETVKGENLSVTVTMGGRDVTAECYANGTLRIAQVSGDIVVTAKKRYDADGHLQPLPEQLCCETNLWTALTPENTYYLGTKWGVYSSSPDVHSITFPVEEGERIWTNAFLAAADKGGGTNGTRITWFSDEGVLASIAREEVYSEYAQNGYITVPAGAAAVNIPYRSKDGGEIYLLDREHQLSYVVEAGQLYERCLGGHRSIGNTAVLEGGTLTVLLKKEIEPTLVYAARYDLSGRLAEVKCRPVTDEFTSIALDSDQGSVKVFFLTEQYVPWLNAICLPAQEAE